MTANATLNNPIIRWYEGSLDYQSGQDVALYPSGQGYKPGSTDLSGNGKLTKGGAGTMTVYGIMANTGGIDVNSGVLARIPMTYITGRISRVWVL